MRPLVLVLLLALFCSCVTRNWYSPASFIPRILPPEIAFTDLNGPAGRGGNLFLTLRLEHGEELAFMVDTGSPVTILDKSLAPRLGKRVGTGEAFFPLHDRREPAGIYRAPAIYLGNTRLLTGRWVITEDLAAMTGGPLGGILGMDCLRHYCLQLDFAQNTLRFLNPNAPPATNLGRPFLLTFAESGPLEVFVPGDFFGTAQGHSQIDTGDPWDGAATSNLLQQAVQAKTADWAQPVDPAGHQKAHFPELTFAGETYSNLVLHVHYRNLISLRFLAWHLVTLNFPQRTMYLKRTSVGPLPDFSSSSSLLKPAVSLHRADQHLNVRARLPGKELWFDLATFLMDPQLRPYLHPVRDPSGRVVLTEDRPADHPWQHGIFTGFHRVNGFNYWKEDEGRQRFVRLLDTRETPERVSWRALVEYIAPNGSAVLEEEDAITFHAPGAPKSDEGGPESANGYVIDFDLLLRARDRDVTFGKFFVGGLSVRMPWDKSNPRHTHLNSEGLRDRACEQQRAAWCNVERPFDGTTYGIAVFDHPSNPNHPPGWRADEQGLINPNISALADWSLPAQQQRLFRYRLLVYRGSLTREQLQGRFQTFAKKPL